MKILFPTLVIATVITVKAVIGLPVKTEVRTVVTSTVESAEIALKIARKYPARRWESVVIKTNGTGSSAVYTVHATKLESTSYE